MPSRRFNRLNSKTVETVLSNVSKNTIKSKLRIKSALAAATAETDQSASIWGKGVITYSCGQDTLA